MKAEGLSARTFVVCDAGTVVGYYSLTMGGIIRAGLPNARLRKNLPDPVPVAIIGRLAVDSRYRGQRIGAGLLKDALLRSINVSREIGCRAVLVHALSESAVAFYRKYGFLQCAIDPRTMVLPIETAIKGLR